MISIQQDVGTTTADILNTEGSQLRRAPGDGEYRLWWAADQADFTYSVNSRGVQVVETSRSTVRTANVILKDGPPTNRWKVAKGDDVIIAATEVTAGTAVMLLEFWDMVDLLMEMMKTPLEVMQALAGQA